MNYKKLIEQNPNIILTMTIILTVLVISLAALLLVGWFKYRRLTQPNESRFCINCESQVIAQDFFAQWNISSGICHACLAKKLHNEAILAQEKNN